MAKAVMNLGESLGLSGITIPLHLGLVEYVGGIEQAIVLQTFHYLEQKLKGKQKNGERWVFYSLAKLRERFFPSWSHNTVDKYVRILIADGFLVKTGGLSTNNTNGYRVVRSKFEEPIHQNLGSCSPGVGKPSPQGLGNHYPKFGQPINKDNTKITLTKISLASESLVSFNSDEFQNSIEEEKEKKEIPSVKKEERKGAAGPAGLVDLHTSSTMELHTSATVGLPSDSGSCIIDKIPGGHMPTKEDILLAVAEKQARTHAKARSGPQAIYKSLCEILAANMEDHHGWSKVPSGKEIGLVKHLVAEWNVDLFAIFTWVVTHWSSVSQDAKTKYNVWQQMSVPTLSHLVTYRAAFRALYEAHQESVAVVVQSKKYLTY